jgi:ParB family chromosome partitioning protein
MKEFLNKIQKLINLKEPYKDYILMKTSEIRTHNDIAKLFQIKPEMVDIITDSMLKQGYDTSQPLSIGQIKGIGEYLIDGHTRLIAAKKAGLEEVPVKKKYFDCLEDAQQYTVKRQVERRNLTEQEILDIVTSLPKKKNRDGSGRSVEKLGNELGISPSTLVHAKAVAEKANQEDLQAIKDGKISINKIYQKIKNKKQIKETADGKQNSLTYDSKKSDEHIDDMKKAQETIHAAEQQETISTSIPNDSKIEDTNVIDKKQANKIAPVIETQGLSSTYISVIIEDILRLLDEHNENNAVKIIYMKYKNSISIGGKIWS